MPRCSDGGGTPVGLAKRSGAEGALPFVGRATPDQGPASPFPLGGKDDEAWSPVSPLWAMGHHNLPINIGHYAGQLYSNRGKQPVSLDNPEFGVIEDGKWASLPVSVFHGSGGGWMDCCASPACEATTGDGMDGRAANGLPAETHWLSGFQALTVDGRAELQAPRSQWHAGPRLQDHRKAERPCATGRGAALRWEDRRSIPDGCGQHVPGLDGHRVTPLCCELRLRERFTVTDRDQGVWSRLGLSGLESRHLQRHTTL